MRRLVANETAGAGKKQALTFVFTTNRKIPDIPGSPSPCFPLLPASGLPALFLSSSYFLIVSSGGGGGCRGDSCHFR